MRDATRIRKEFDTFGQAHVFQGFDQLSATDQERLLTQASTVNLPKLHQLITTLVKSRSTPFNKDQLTLQTTPYIARPENGGSQTAWDAARRRGEAALRAGKVAAVTVAGGQGTRLGVDGPKGALPITPVTGKPLFQVFAEKILAAQQRYKQTVPWLIMTSPMNHRATLDFFEEHHYFGLDPSTVHSFTQRQMPVVDFQGRILCENPHTLAFSPDGHGGLFQALLDSGLLDHLRSTGIELLSYFQVDNPLVHCIDPAFIGFHIEAGSDLSSKAILKTDPNEKVGLFCQRGDRLAVVEYIDIAPEQAAQRDSSGRLKHRTGNPAIHLLSCDFIDETARTEALPFHRAEKNLPQLNSQGRPITPHQPNAIQFERFLFDALAFARNPILVESKRIEEFSPVKNALGPKSPETCKRDQLRLFYRWAQAAGVHLPSGKGGLPAFPFEISPLFAEDEAIFVEKWYKLVPKPVFKEGMVLEAS